MLETTEERFKVFEAECVKWVEFFGLKDWCISYVHGDLETETRAEVSYTCADRLAIITLAKEWNEIDGIVIDDDLIRKTAFHEVCELLLGKLTSTVGSRRALTEEEIIEETHRIIRTMENTVFAAIHL